ncbi:phosphopantetheine-binding protein [Streptomyces sp. NPDC102274]|uniref:phosphopantetheine-binding protein n=1 Tax=Streptomyces sp. NPDC102274 TaxID=3366151 RepID=UPI0037F61FC1
MESPTELRSAHSSEDPLLNEVLTVWRRQLGHDDFTPHDDFSSIGGNSIDAIQVIADLQSRGHRVSAAAFLAEPTTVALATRLRAGAAGEGPGTTDRPVVPFPAEDTALSPAQEWFFRQHFSQPDQWNQALLLDADLRDHGDQPHQHPDRAGPPRSGTPRDRRAPDRGGTHPRPGRRS